MEEESGGVVLVVSEGGAVGGAAGCSGKEREREMNTNLVVVERLRDEELVAEAR